MMTLHRHTTQLFRCFDMNMPHYKKRQWVGGELHPVIATMVKVALFVQRIPHHGSIHVGDRKVGRAICLLPLSMGMERPWQIPAWPIGGPQWTSHAILDHQPGVGPA